MNSNNLNKELYETSLAVVKIAEKLLAMEQNEEKRRDLVSTITVAKLGVIDAITERLFFCEQNDAVKEVSAVGKIVLNEMEWFLNQPDSVRTQKEKDLFMEDVSVYYKLILKLSRPLKLFQDDDSLIV